MTKKFTPLVVVAAALTDQSGRWLMHRRPKDKQHGGLWEFPGGKVEKGETPCTALVREVEEESALRLDPDSLVEAGFAFGQDEAGEDGIVILLYTAFHWSGTMEAREGGEFRWFLPSEIAALDRPPLDIILSQQLFSKHV